MKLTVTQRMMQTKGMVKAIRREGNIPAIIYGSDKSVEMVVVNGNEFQAGLRKLPQGRLATSVIELCQDEKVRRAIIKDVQYHVATYRIQHIDFLLLNDQCPVTVNVPIQISGIADCPGIKLGGVFRQVIHSLKVSCLPKNIPNEFKIDISEMNISQSKCLSSVVIPPNVRVLAPMNEVAVVIAKGKVSS
jgi:large subunit ribosomal protein L25